MFFLLMVLLSGCGFTLFYHLSKGYEHITTSSQTVRVDWNLLKDTLGDIETMSRVLTDAIYAEEFKLVSEKQMEVRSDLPGVGDIISRFIKTKNEVVETPASFIDDYSVGSQ